MSIFENRLALACKQVSETASELLEWVDDNEGLVMTERVALLRELYRAGAAAQRLAAAVNTMSCIAFAGPRRSGKSQLMSALVERGNAPLALRFDGIQESIGFHRQIVPESGRFGTSAAIRLSAKSKQTPQNFPIAVRIVPMPEVVKILGSAFFTAAPERRDLVPGVLRVREILGQVMGRLSPTPVPGMREDDVWDIRDYFAAKFRDEPILRVLAAAGFWEFLAEHATNVSNEDRGRLLGLVWGELPQFTAIYVTLADALARLGYGREASCALDAILGLDQRTGKLTRRPDSILSAATLSTLGQPDDQALVVRTELGQWVSLSRSVLAALVAELRLPMKGHASDLLERADLVEMPSIEPREAIPGLGQALANDTTLAGQLFMRSKAVLLAERYTADNEITSMVVCIDPSTRKLAELPRLVAEWVDESHGADPTERETNDAGLFVAFTKLDRELTEPVRRGKERRLDIAGRIGAMLTEELGRGYGWPHEWSPGRAFDRVHIVRNPTSKTKQLCDFDNFGRETGYKATIIERIERARTDLLASPAAARHIADAASVWKEALELNDGGITYLAQSLVNVCDMRVKQRQVMSSLVHLRHSMKNRLQRYYVSDNFALQQAGRHSAALLTIRRLRQAAGNKRLGALIRALQVGDAELADVLGKIATLRQHQEKQAGAKDMPTEAAVLARAAAAHWIELMRSTAGAADAGRQFELPQAVLLNLVDELIVGANRLDLESEIASRIEGATGPEQSLDRRVTIAAMCASSLISEFVMWLGCNDMRSNTRPRRKGKAEVPIFPPRGPVDLAKLDETDAATGEDKFHADWSQAYMAMVTDSTANLRERDLSAEQNRRLGQLMMQLDATI